MNSNRSCCRRNLAVTLPFALSLILASANSHAFESSAKVELRLKILSAFANQGQTVNWWIAAIKDARGPTVRVATGGDGETVGFKNLDPGIYLVCLLGSLNREDCKSFDLYPPAGSRFYRFNREMKAPTSILHQEDANTVHITEIAVPKAARNELIKAENAFYKGKVGEAEQHFLAAVKIHPNYGEALNNLGIYYRRNGDLQNAVECFNKVTQLNPESYGGWANLGNSLIPLARFGEALDAGRIAYKLRPNEPAVLSLVAQSLFYLRQYRESREYFEMLAKLDPENPVFPHLYLAKVSIMDGDTGSSKQYIETLLRLHPNLPMVPYLQAMEQFLGSPLVEDTVKATGFHSSAQPEKH
jgi:tetratricopeptide (TPR) repeat protein